MLQCLMMAEICGLILESCVLQSAGKFKFANSIDSPCQRLFLKGSWEAFPEMAVCMPSKGTFDRRYEDTLGDVRVSW